VAHVDEFVARTVTVDLEGGDLVIERDLVLRFRSKRKRADTRVKAVGADDEVGIARRRMIESNVDAVVMFFDGGHRIAEDRFDLALTGTIDRRGEIRAAHAGEAILGHTAEDVDVESTPLSALAIDEAHFADLIAEAPDLPDKPHLLGDVVADAPKIDDVAAA